MAGEWHEITVGDFAPFAYGKGLPEVQRNANGNVPVYGSNGVVGFHDAPLTGGPTVVIGRKGTVGAVHYSPVPCWPIDTTFFMSGSDPSLVRYRYYVLKSLGLEHMNADSAVPGLSRAAAHVRRVRVPSSEDEQRAIAQILGTMDDKIETNRRMNETLEAMARALFKSWFVDFDPVRAKAKDRDPGLLQPLADLFPDRLVDSELGEIPEGWEVKGLDQIARFLNGLALQKYPPVGARSLPVIKIAQLRSGRTDGADLASADLDPDYIVADGDILFSWSGSLECVLWAGGPGALNQHLFKVTSSSHPRWLCFFAVHHHLDDFRHIAAGKATTMGHIQRRHLSDAKFAVPPARLLRASSEHLEPMLESFWKREVETRTIADLRDTLLPKLISGKLQIKDAKRFMVEADA